MTEAKQTNYKSYVIIYFYDEDLAARKQVIDANINLQEVIQKLNLN